MVIVRSCVEIEPEWYETVRRIYGKPVFPVRVLPSGDEECGNGEDSIGGGRGQISERECKKNDGIVWE